MYMKVNLERLEGLNPGDYESLDCIMRFENNKLDKHRLNDWLKRPDDVISPIDLICSFTANGWKVVLLNQEVIWLHAFGEYTKLVDSLHEIVKANRVVYREYNAMVKKLCKQCSNIPSDKIFSTYEQSLTPDLEFVNKKIKEDMAAGVPIPPVKSFITL